MRVLIVDDSAATLAIIQRALNKFDYRHLSIKQATNVVEALSVIGEWQPAIVLTDWQMPDISGLSLIQEVIKRNLPIKIAMITTVDDEQQTLEAMRAGANFVLSKPFSDQELYDKLLPVVQEVEQSLIINDREVVVDDELALPKLSQLQRALERTVAEDIEIKTVQTQSFDESKIPCLMAMFEDPDTQRVRSIALLDLYAIAIFATGGRNNDYEHIQICLRQKVADETIVKTCEGVLSAMALAFIDVKTKKTMRLRNINFITKPFSKLTALYDIQPTKRLDFSCQQPNTALGIVTIVGF